MATGKTAKTATPDAKAPVASEYPRGRDAMAAPISSEAVRWQVSGRANIQRADADLDQLHAVLANTSHLAAGTASVDLATGTIAASGVVWAETVDEAVSSALPMFYAALRASGFGPGNWTETNANRL